MKRYEITLVSGYKQIVYGLSKEEVKGTIFIKKQVHALTDDCFTIPSRIVQKVEVI